ncbi:MAG: hypothetical protein KAR47_18790 [Planctomycetes bacterium]|nr:hypothetical protein [Planctomycetota bacterium]
MSMAIQQAALVESIEHEGRLIARIVRAEKMPDRTEFITEGDVKQQVGFIVYPADSEIDRHVHLPLERHLVGTSEVLLVRKGVVDADFYTDDKEYIDTRELREGDLVLLVSGGHGFRCREDTILLEIKQGPYTGLVEKERF